MFGYDILDNNYGNQISLSLKNIEKSLKEISDSSIFFENNNEYTEALVEVAKPFLDILSNQLVDNIMMAAATVNIK